MATENAGTASSAGLLSFFPFERVRDGQREFMQDVFSSIRDGASLVAHAPTGIGKTAATIVPAIYEVVSNGGCVFFLTPKHSQHRIVIDTIRKVRERSQAGCKVVALDFIGKKWLCPYPAAADLSSSEFADYCTSVRRDETCPFYNNTISKKKGSTLSMKTKALVKKLIESPPLHAEEAVKLCASESMCPFEVMTEAAKSANIIVCDYYHLFSPQVRKSFLFKTKKNLEDSIVIVDETQNLPSRLREILSHRLSELGLERARNEARNFGFHDLADRLDGMKVAIRELALAKSRMENEKEKRSKGGRDPSSWMESEFLTTKAEVLESLNLIPDDTLRRTLEELESVSGIAIEKQRKSSVTGVNAFLKAWSEGADLGFVRSVRIAQSRGGRKYYAYVSYKCLDPAMASHDVFSQARSVILMSGTLTPTKMYSDILGLAASSSQLHQAVYASPYNPANRLNIIDTSCTTKFSMRTQKEFELISKKCADILKACPGSAAIFFPSYAVKENISKILLGLLPPDLLVLNEVRNTTKSDKTRLLLQLQAARRAVLLGVAGGSFSEGVDFPGNVLKCVILVGLPLQVPDLEVKELIKYYDQLFGRGWDYGYTYPAIAKAVQAAGRSIRSETDRAVVVFMDARYAWTNYLKCLPPELNIVKTSDPAPLVEGFWNKKPNA